ncbi:MAG TPA: SpoIIE family protein phosphatase [Gammaproteobacteria bacterium]
MTEELLQWGIASRSYEDSDESGDLSLVVPFSGGALVAVIDGLGHGIDAAASARQAAEVLKVYANESPISLIQRCHEKLKPMRGAVMSLASFNAAANMLTWVGVGNVEGCLIRTNSAAVCKNEFLRLHGGTVGDRIPSLQAEKLPIYQGDVLIFTTDGIRNGNFARVIGLRKKPARIAEYILDQWGREDDDSLVLVVRSLIGYT